MSANPRYQQDGMRLNSGLTQFASDLIMLPQNFVANIIAPPIAVPSLHGFYRVMDRSAALSTAQDTTVAKGESPKVFDKHTAKAPFETGRDALKYLLSDDEEMGSDMEAVDFLKDMTEMANVFAAKREIVLANLILNAGSYGDASQIIAVTAGNEWDDSTSKPSIDVDRAKRIVKEISGYNANTLLVPDLVYKALWRNDEVQKFNVGFLEGRTMLLEGQLPSFRLFGLNVVNADAINNAVGPLQGTSLGYLWENISPYFGSWAWIGYVDPIPSQKTGSFASQFAFRPARIAGASTDPLFGMIRVLEYYDPDVEGTYYAVRSNTGLKVTNDKAGALITGVTTATS